LVQSPRSQVQGLGYDEVYSSPLLVRISVN
jgi:hypothetical protein